MVICDQVAYLFLKGVKMKYIWMLLIIIMLAGIGVAYVFSDVIDYFFPKPPQTEIVVLPPDRLK